VSKSGGKVGARRQGRECAVQVLFQLDAGEFHATADEALSLFWASDLSEGEERPSDETRAFTGELVAGVVRELKLVDKSIQKSTQHWKLERMARVDRNILRLAAYELLHIADVPARVVLNEAIDIAKKFGTAESGAFVNGILDRLAQDVRRGE
jgi:N utilization substance protein B